MNKRARVFGGVAALVLALFVGFAATRGNETTPALAQPTSPPATRCTLQKRAALLLLVGSGARAKCESWARIGRGNPNVVQKRVGDRDDGLEQVDCMLTSPDGRLLLVVRAPQGESEAGLCRLLESQRWQRDGYPLGEDEEEDGG